jgi:hypothetical protein
MALLLLLLPLRKHQTPSMLQLIKLCWKGWQAHSSLPEG